MAGRDGFTLIEIIVAIVMLSFILLGVVGSTMRLETAIRGQERRTLAIELAEERIAQIQIDPDYGTLEERYVGEDRPVAEHSEFVRATVAREVLGADGEEHKVFTVAVDGPGVGETVERTILVAAP